MTINELKYLITTKIYTNGVEDITGADLQEVLLEMADSAFTDVIDRLDSDRIDAALSANQGKVLNDKIISILNDTSDIHTKINTIFSELSSLSDKLDNEIQNRVNADDTLLNNINQEIQDRKNADITIKQDIGIINDNVSDLSNRLNGEITYREQADSALETKINNEIQNRIKYDDILDSKLNTEIQDRKDADIVIHQKLNQEITERKDDVNTINTRVTIEIEDRINADKLINKRIDDIEIGGVDLSNYYTKSEVDTKVNTKQNTLTAGTNIIINGNTISAKDTVYDDTAIKTLINSKADKSELPDLTNYYTKLEVNEAIDEAITGGEVDLTNYYTKSQADTLLADKSDKTTTYTKSEVDNLIDDIDIPDVDLSNYYTKNQTDTLLSSKADTSSVANKQDKLTAGANITISGNTISATNTIYDDTAVRTLINSKADKFTVGNGLGYSSNQITLNVQHLVLTQAEFDAIPTKDNNTIYYIK